MTKAHVAKSTDEIDEILALQGAEPGTARNITTEEQAIAEAILDAEDGYVVLRGDGDGDPVWYISDNETPPLGESTLHVCWPAGATWPRERDDDHREPGAIAAQAVAEDFRARCDDIADAADAADLAVTELLDDPAGWPRFVPAHWKPGAWVDCYRTAYAAEWMEQQ